MKHHCHQAFANHRCSLPDTAADSGDTKPCCLPTISVYASENKWRARRDNSNSNSLCTFIVEAPHSNASALKTCPGSVHCGGRRQMLIGTFFFFFCNGAFSFYWSQRKNKAERGERDKRCFLLLHVLPGTGSAGTAARCGMPSFLMPDLMPVDRSWASAPA